MGNEIEKVIGVLPITNRICYGKVDKEKKLWVGNREDVTDMAISAVFDWFFNQMDGKDEFYMLPRCSWYEVENGKRRINKEMKR